MILYFDFFYFRFVQVVIYKKIRIEGVKINEIINKYLSKKIIQFLILKVVIFNSQGEKKEI